MPEFAASTSRSCCGDFFSACTSGRPARFSSCARRESLSASSKMVASSPGLAAARSAGLEGARIVRRCLLGAVLGSLLGLGLGSG